MDMFPSSYLVDFQGKIENMNHFPISPMANEESKNENPENQTPAEEEQPVEGLTADQAAEKFLRSHRGLE